MVQAGWPRGVLALTTLSAGLVAGAPALVSDRLSGQGERPTESLTVVGEHRYRLSGSIRPLLLFWIDRDNVGGARLAWLGGTDRRRGFELTIGSDPERAPRRTNRWGYVREETDGGATVVLGLMTQSDEQSLAEAESRVGASTAGGVPFKLIRARVSGDETTSSVTTFRTATPHTYRDAAAVLAAPPPAGATKTRTAKVPPGTSPGFMTAATGLIHEAVTAAVGPRRPRKLVERRSVAYTFNATLYELTLKSTEWVDHETVKGRRYDRLVRLSFEVASPPATWRERFVLTCGTEGPLAEVPVHIRYQPRWWFKVEAVLDERERF